MSNIFEKIDGVREVSPQEGAVLCARGTINDFSRDNVIVHVGKPVGSITGWVGPIFWQVWVDRSAAAGSVQARIDQNAPETWEFDSSLSKEEILDAAKTRIVEQAQALRKTRLASAEAELSSLAAA